MTTAQVPRYDGFPLYDVVIVGAGVIGTFTAYSLAQRGKVCLLIDQFKIPNDKNSSGGLSRIIRKIYPEGDHYTKMMIEAYRLWDELEKRSEEKLFINCQTMVVSPKKSELLPLQKCFERFSLPYKYLTSDDLKAKFIYNNFNDVCGIIDLDGGILLADKCIHAALVQYKKHGGHTCENETVEYIENDDVKNFVKVKTNDQIVFAWKVVVTVGPWLSSLSNSLGLENIPLKPQPSSVFYWNMRKKGTYSHENFPCFMHVGSPKNSVDVYALPAYEFEDMMKLVHCNHTKENYQKSIQPLSYSKQFADTLKVFDPSKTISKELLEYIRRYFPYLEEWPSRMERCSIMSTSDSNPILDYLPQTKNIILGLGFSGHGFKLAPIVGEILSDLVEETIPPFEMYHFSIERFNKQSKL